MVHAATCVHPSTAKRKNARVGESVGGGVGEGEEFTVDLATLGHYLDTIMVQPLNARLRFLFDIHDANGDGSLSELELKAVMDTLLGGLFDRDPAKGESYLMAISNFVNSAYQFGTSTAASYGATPSVSSGRGGESGPAPDPTRLPAPPMLGRARSFSVTPSTTNSAAASVNPRASLDVPGGRGGNSNSNGNGNGSGHPGYRLSFNEFLLAMLSQPVFVHFFEGTWALTRAPRLATGEWGDVAFVAGD
jgi:hypothetical protein